MVDLHLLKVSINDERSHDEGDLGGLSDFGLREKSDDYNSEDTMNQQDQSLNELLQNVNPEPHRNSEIDPEIDHRKIPRARKFSTGNTTYNSFEFEYRGHNPKETKNGIYASTPTHNSTAPSFYFPSCLTQPSLHDQESYMPEPPPPPTPFDFERNCYHDVFQNSDPNKRIDFESSMSLSLIFRI